MTKKNYYSHYYLYAKGWYKTSDDPMLDLRHITSAYSGSKVEHIRSGDVITVLMNAVRHCMEHSEREAKAFFTAFVYRTLEEDLSVDGFIRASLEQLMMTKGTNLNLDAPTSDVLELKDVDTLKRWKEMRE